MRAGKVGSSRSLAIFSMKVEGGDFRKLASHRRARHGSQASLDVKGGPMQTLRCARSVSRAVLLLAAALIPGAEATLLGMCGPFTDVAPDVFCPFVLEIFSLGITTGTTATTYDPTGNVARLQMAAFLSRTVDGVLRRGNRRAALNQFWTVAHDHLFGALCSGPGQSVSDGQ